MFLIYIENIQNFPSKIDRICPEAGIESLQEDLHPLRHSGHHIGLWPVLLVSKIYQVAGIVMLFQKRANAFTTLDIHPYA